MSKIQYKYEQDEAKIEGLAASLRRSRSLNKFEEFLRSFQIISKRAGGTGEGHNFDLTGYTGSTGSDKIVYPLHVPTKYHELMYASLLRLGEEDRPDISEKLDPDGFMMFFDVDFTLSKLKKTVGGAEGDGGVLFANQFAHTQKVSAEMRVEEFTNYFAKVIDALQRAIVAVAELHYADRHNGAFRDMAVFSRTCYKYHIYLPKVVMNTASAKLFVTRLVQYLADQEAAVTEGWFSWTDTSIIDPLPYSNGLRVVGASKLITDADNFEHSTAFAEIRGAKKRVLYPLNCCYSPHQEVSRKRRRSDSDAGRGSSDDEEDDEENEEDDEENEEEEEAPTQALTVDLIRRFSLRNLSEATFRETPVASTILSSSMVDLDPVISQWTAEVIERKLIKVAQVAKALPVQKEDWSKLDVKIDSIKKMAPGDRNVSEVHWQVALPGQPCPFISRLHQRTLKDNNSPLFAEIFKDRVQVKCWDCTPKNHEHKRVFPLDDEQYDMVDFEVILRAVLKAIMHPLNGGNTADLIALLMRKIFATPCSVEGGKPTRNSTFIYYQFLQHDHRWVDRYDEFEYQLRHTDGIIYQTVTNIKNSLSDRFPEDFEKFYAQWKKQFDQGFSGSTVGMACCKINTYWSEMPQPFKETRLLQYQDRLNYNGALIGMKNGVLEMFLRKPVVFRAGVPEDYISYSTHQVWPGFWEKTAEHNDGIHRDYCEEPKKRIVMKYVVSQFPDPEEREFHLLQMGRALNGERLTQCMTFVQGAGSDGKSVLYGRVFGAVFGDYYLSANQNCIVGQDNTSSSSSREDEMQLRFKRIIVYMEPDLTKAVNFQKVKVRTGDDLQNNRGHYGKAITYRLKATHFVVGNAFPHIATFAGDYSIPRRFLPVLARTRYLPTQADIDSHRGENDDSFKHMALMLPASELDAVVDVLSTHLLPLYIHYYDKYRHVENIQDLLPQTLKDKKAELTSANDECLAFMNHCLKVPKPGDEEFVVSEEDLWKEFNLFNKYHPQTTSVHTIRSFIEFKSSMRYTLRKAKPTDIADEVRGYKLCWRSKYCGSERKFMATRTSGLFMNEELNSKN
jgi:hypothetical protein